MVLGKKRKKKFKTRLFQTGKTDALALQQEH